MEAYMNIEVGKKIYELRKNKNITQKKLASEIGVSVAAVTDNEVIDSAIKLGVSVYIAKPFLPDKIIASIGEI
jgi:DNA-binding XRE family transcriptional regulator